MEDLGTYSKALGGREILLGTLGEVSGSAKWRGESQHAPTVQRQPAGWALWAQLVFNTFQLSPQAPVSWKGHRVPPLALEWAGVCCSFLSCKCPMTFHPILVFAHALPFPEIPAFLVFSFQSFKLLVKSTSSCSNPRQFLPHLLSPIQKYSHSRLLTRTLWEASYGIFQETPGNRCC